MPARDFDVARRERLAERDPLQFTLGGVTFTCLPVVPVGDALDLADAPESADAAVPFAASLVRFIDRILYESDRAKFADVLRDRHDPVDAVALYEIVEWLGEQYAARPTRPSAASSGGPEGSGPTSSSDAAPTAQENSPT